MTTFTKLKGGLAEIKVTLPWEELASFFLKAADILAKRHLISGFRPGKVPFEIIKQKFGEKALYEEATPLIIQDSLMAAIKEHTLFTIGEPEITIVKFAPFNPFEYKAKIAILPEVKLPNWRSIKVKRQEVKVEEQELETALKNLQMMRRKEHKVEREARKDDKVIINLDLFLDGVAVEGGSARGHGVYLFEPYYIPGFNDQLLGLKAGDEKAFSLKFPSTHYQARLKGRDVDFKVKMLEVYELQIPALDDNFAKEVGQADAVSLRALIQKNIQEEKYLREEERAEEELFTALTKATKYGEIPDILLKGEVKKMVDELFAHLREKEIDPEKYLNYLKKTSEDLNRDFLPPAEERVKAGLFLRAVAQEQGIEGEAALVSKKIVKLLKDICLV